MHLQFGGEIWFWRGPSPFHFVTVPASESSALHDIAGVASYGWGVIPVEARIARTSWSTSLIPKDGAYLVPLKTLVRTGEGLEVGDFVTIEVTVRLPF